MLTQLEIDTALAQRGTLTVDETNYWKGVREVYRSRRAELRYRQHNGEKTPGIFNKIEKLNDRIQRIEIMLDIELPF